VAKLTGGQAVVPLHGTPVKAAPLRDTRDAYEHLVIREIMLR
jgi:hypothetical protein